MSWIAGASVFSGRPDPTWPITDELGAQLAQLWTSLPKTRDRAAPRPPQLGYRGCFALSPDGRRWTAYRQLVKLDAGRRPETRFDSRREFESLVLRSAPEGTLPPRVLNPPDD